MREYLVAFESGESSNLYSVSLVPRSSTRTVSSAEFRKWRARSEKLSWSLGSAAVSVLYRKL